MSWHVLLADEEVTASFNYGRGIIFVAVLVGCIIVGLYLFMYLSHCLLTVVEQTGAGADRVTWPDEPFHDWVGKLFYLGGLVVFWLIPIVGIMKLSEELIGPLDIPIRSLVTVTALWLIFPISLISVLTGHSRWQILQLSVLRRSCLIPGTTLTLYVASGFLLAVTGALGYLSLAGQKLEGVVPLPNLLGTILWLLLPVCAVAAATTSLLYARLLGRYALLLGRVKVPAYTPFKPVISQENAPVPAAVQPEEPTPAEAPALALETFGFADEIALPTSTAEPANVADMPADARPPSSGEGLYFPGRDRGLPATPRLSPSTARKWGLLGKRVYFFPWYRTSLRIWLWLTFAWLSFAFFLRLAVETWPF